MRRNQFPDYFGSGRLIEPVYGKSKDHQYSRAAHNPYSRSTIQDAEVDEQDDDHYTAQGAGPRSTLPLLTSRLRPSASMRSDFQPNQWPRSVPYVAARQTTAASPALSTARETATPRQIRLTDFVYQEPEAHNLQDLNQQPRMRLPAYNFQASRRQAQQHDISELALPQTPQPSQSANFNSWLHLPRANSTRPAMYGTLMTEDGETDTLRQREDGRSDDFSPSTLSILDEDRRPSYVAQVVPRPVPRCQSAYQHQPMAPPTPQHSSPSPLSAKRGQIQFRPQKVPQIKGIQLISPQCLDKKFQPIFPYQHFNAVQSSCFSCVYGSLYNVVVAAPTGSGKTVIFELAICKLLASFGRTDFKIVYQAPTKALCAERTRDWQKKFKPLGLEIAELTGDTSAAGVRCARAASIIVTTPEKWDSITRKWSDHGTLLKTVKLVLIDEVHILKDTRGATLETVVSRMKTLGSEVRFVALSATIPNSTDIAQWLGLTHTSTHVPAKTFVYGDEFRPVQLEKVVIGYNVGGGNEHSFDSLLDDQLPNLIVKHSQGKPVLIFCFTRKSTESAAKALSEYWSMCSPAQRPWPAPATTIRSSARLQSVVATGVAFHHGGLEKQDRTSIEEAFLQGHLSIVCCTSTLAVGVNLPCHTVILKGTMGYQNGGFSEYDEFEVMQMIGRAGRPQFDSSATAIILTRAENRERYLSIESGCQTVESTLHLNLIEHLNSEIVLGTVTSLAKAVQWLRGSFLAVRLRQNPDHYKLTDETAQARTTDEQLQEICKVGISRLADVGLIQYVDHSDSEFRATQYGSAMSMYMVRFETMVMILGLPKSMTTEELVNSLCHASEFNELRIKSTERQAYRELNKSQNIPFKIKDNITETWQKISLLIQTELSRGVLPYQHRMAMEAKQAIERMQRLLESYIVCTIADNNGYGTKASLEFSRSLIARAWEGHMAQLCQIPDIGPVNMKKLADKRVTNVLDLAGLSSVDIERLLSKNPPAAMKIADALKSFPRLFLEGQVEKTRGEYCVEGTGVEPRANVRVTLGCTNIQGPPRWRNRVPSVTFLAMTKEGTLLHLWRGKLEHRERQISFCVPHSSADQVYCEFSCDEIVGTNYSLLLPAIEVSPEVAASWSTITVPLTSKRLRDGSRNTTLQSAKRQKLSSYPTHPITVGDTIIDCIDLSVVDEIDAECPRTPLSNRKRSQMLAGVTNNDSQDTYATQSMSVKKSRSSGRGTQQDPLTLNEDSDSDDIDTFDEGIFDQIEMPAVKESLNETILRDTAKTPPASVFRLYNVTDKTSKDTVSRTDGLSLLMSESLPPSASPNRAIASCTASLDQQTAKSPRNLEISNKLESFSQEKEQVVENEESGSKGKENRFSESRGSAQLEADDRGEPTVAVAEPSWVSFSNSGIVDFLRGHVTFV